MRPRILYIQRPTGGGSTMSLYELIRGLDTTRFEPLVLFYVPGRHCHRFGQLGVRLFTLSESALTALTSGPSGDNIPPIIERTPVYQAAKQTRQLVWHDLPVARQIATLIRREAVDLAHVNNSVKGSRTAVMGAWLAGVPQICHVRFLHSYSLVDRFWAGKVTRFIYISDAVAATSRSMDVPRERGEVIYNPVDVDAFATARRCDELRATLGVAATEPMIANVGRLVPWKGHDPFIRAMAEVVRVYPQARAVIVGAADPGNLEYYASLQQLVATLRLSDNVLFSGWRSDVPAIMASSDVVVHSASKPEPFGRVVVEAMAAGRPVVATDAGGVVEIVDDGETGVLVPPGDVPTMADAIVSLLRDSAAAKQMGRRAQERVANRFSVERHVSAVQAMYTRIVESAARAAA